MRYLTEQKLILILIAGCLAFLLYSRLSTPETEITTETDSPEAVKESAHSPSFRERVIYTCRLENEEIPGVQISEVAGENGETAGTIARADVGPGLEMIARGAVPVWDFKSVSAHSGNTVIEIAFQPQAAKDGEDWVFTLADGKNRFSRRVRDCQEISDE